MKRLLLAIIVIFATLIPVSAAQADGWIVSCSYDHSNNDDPIVSPGVPGAAHLHDYSSAKTTNAFSTFSTLRASSTSCVMPGDTSAYWVPAMYVDGVRTLPTATQKDSLFYYRRTAVKSGPVQPFPDGLKIIIGNAHATSPMDNPQLGNDIIFKCGPGVNPEFSHPPTQCASGVLTVSVMFPSCWNGFQLDSANHRSHMAYPIGNVCPASHPVVVPRLESFFRYPVGTGPIGNVTFASGPYYTIHQDFFNAWRPQTMTWLLANCMNNGANCGQNPNVPV